MFGDVPLFRQWEKWTSVLERLSTRAVSHEQGGSDKGQPTIWYRTGYILREGPWAGKVQGEVFSFPLLPAQQTFFFTLHKRCTERLMQQWPRAVHYRKIWNMVCGISLCQRFLEYMGVLTFFLYIYLAGLWRLFILKVKKKR